MGHGQGLKPWTHLMSFIGPAEAVPLLQSLPTAEQPE
jgi:hypothetical protein